MATLMPRHVAHERLLHVGVGIAQLTLASFFTVMALLKLLLEPTRLVEIMAWTETLPLPVVRSLGLLELVGSIAVAAPAVTRLPQRIVGSAALAFLTLMMSAAIIHVARGEYRMVALNLSVACVAAFVAWGRLMHAPLED